MIYGNLGIQGGHNHVRFGTATVIAPEVVKPRTLLSQFEKGSSDFVDFEDAIAHVADAARQRYPTHSPEVCDALLRLVENPMAPLSRQDAELLEPFFTRPRLTWDERSALTPEERFQYFDSYPQRLATLIRNHHRYGNLRIAKENEHLLGLTAEDAKKDTPTKQAPKVEDRNPFELPKTAQSDSNLPIAKFLRQKGYPELDAEDLAKIAHLKIVEEIGYGKEATVYALADGRVLKLYNGRRYPFIPEQLPWTIPIEGYGAFGPKGRGSYPGGSQVVPKIKEIESLRNPHCGRAVVYEFEKFANACGYSPMMDGAQIGTYTAKDGIERVVVYDTGATGFTSDYHGLARPPEDPEIKARIDSRVPIYKQCRVPIERLYEFLAMSPERAAQPGLHYYEEALAQLKDLRNQHEDLQRLIPPSFIKVCEKKFSELPQNSDQ